MGPVLPQITLDLGKDDTCAQEHRAEIPRIAFMELAYGVR
jgi:hypothetical protein